MKMDKVKLIIWDLDETFWGGTLSEEGITPISFNLSLVKELSKNGVVNSICSKNDFEAAKKKLKELGVWEFFVFPKISWGAKGPQVKSTISEMGLRETNVLFIDDNIMNVKEVQHFCPRIQTLMPQDTLFQETLLSVISEFGNADPKLERLEQYRVLENKTIMSKSFDTNEKFLNQSQIVVGVIESPLQYIDRITDLVERSNQLNYTKLREGKDAIESNIKSDRTYAIHVKDKYGDYGIVGYVAFVRGKIKHFVFSCRTLNMGVEIAVYHYFECPQIIVSGDVATDLNNSRPDWVSIEKVSSQSMQGSIKKIQKNKVLFLGGCDLAGASVYMEKYLDVDTYFNYQSQEHSKLQIHRDGIDYLTLALEGDKQKINNVIETCFFVDEGSFKLPDLNHYSTIIYSPLIDFIQGRYVNKKDRELQISFGDVREPLDSQDFAAKLVDKKSLPKNAMDLFLQHWEYIDFDYEKYKQRLKTFLSTIQPDIKVILLNGAKTTYSDLDSNLEIHHSNMNRILRELETELKGVQILDVNNFLKTSSDFTNAIRHYRRSVYFQIARGLMAMAMGSFRYRMFSIREFFCSNLQIFTIKLLDWKRQFFYFRKKLRKKIINLLS